MHQPPPIPEGDEETEGIVQDGEGTHFPRTRAQPQVPPMHDSTATAEELQTREDSGEGYGKTPQLQNEMIAVSGGEPTEAPQQAEYVQASTVDKPIIDDQAMEGTPIDSDAENEIKERSNDQDGLGAISEDENTLDESRLAHDPDTHLSTVEESPAPQDHLDVPARIDKHPRIDGSIPTTPDKQRLSTKSPRDISHIEFKDLDHEDDYLEIIHPEPEIQISREELLARYQAAEVERDRLRSINVAFQQRLAEYLQKRKGTEDIPTVNQGAERSTAELQQRYQKYLSEIETLQRRIEHDQVDYEKKRNEYEQQIQTKKEHVDELKVEYVKLVKQIASKAVFTRSGKSISNQEVENYLTQLREKEEDLIKTRHENIRLKNQLKKRELQLKSKEELAEGFHMIDFEQLKIENQTYSEKIEERNEELSKLRKKIGTTVQILSHIKEKLNYVGQQRAKAENSLKDKETEVKQKRDELATIKRRRDRLRQENQLLKQSSGLIGNEQLLRDYEERYDEIERCTDKLDNLKKRHAEITLTCKVLKKKISKVQ
ncbi:unnamed protein product [Adineta steineri]|uniref:CCDC113/CCDC96 coiled-coil domain-containing protein n=1 Tax=Adineta steineri TaxID=433720 RepID=A0A818TST7_9BILA|nr:unnamed protein product [Adineta steineri]CAF1216210.1 unnamed protein product [Adineta steineri]CAF3690948.1 unnamed protein product [Adineta steineri]CAF3994400.1 unnamed protein product [Adineta steineri]